jgi:serine palmitoyltransferase
MSHLEQILREQAKKDGKREVTNRRFIVFQGVYESLGDVAPLKKIVELKHKYCYRLLMDDSFGIGVLGKTGRGTVEHFDVPISDIDILSATLENAIGSIGGFCVGSPQVVEHQRLGGAAYCFSASLPPYLATASIEALSILKRDGKQLLPKLEKNTTLMINGLNKMLPQPLHLDATPGIPIMHIRLKKYDHSQHKVVHKKVQQIVREALKQGVHVSAPQYSDREYQRPAPSVKVTVTAHHTEEEIQKCISVLTPIVSNVFGQ